ncbi:MAG: IS481 family transposase [Planctomycetota bacterium]|nr:IS481 family transposase [Planctomycetota bacterium]
MNLHSNARTTPHTRLLLCQRVLEEGWCVTDASRAMGISRSTAYKWLWRYDSEGESGLEDRSSAPRKVWNRTSRWLVRRIEQLRRKKLIAWAIAQQLQMALSTVGGILRRLGLGRLSALEPKEPVERYERERPGELIHLDVKKLGRFAHPGRRVDPDPRCRNRGLGFEYVHVCVDDHTRLAYAEILPNERKESAIGFLERAAGWLEGHGVSVEGVLTDNGSAYCSYAFRDACEALGVRHLRTRPYRPQTNGKAERFIQTMLRQWAYVRPYPSGAARAKALGPWLEHYNRRKPHGSLGGKTPYDRLRNGV